MELDSKGNNISIGDRVKVLWGFDNRIHVGEIVDMCEGVIKIHTHHVKINTINPSKITKITWYFGHFLPCYRAACPVNLFFNTRCFTISSLKLWQSQCRSKWLNMQFISWQVTTSSFRYGYHLHDTITREHRSIEHKEVTDIISTSCQISTCGLSGAFFKAILFGDTAVRESFITTSTSIILIKLLTCQICHEKLIWTICSSG